MPASEVVLKEGMLDFVNKSRDTQLNWNVRQTINNFLVQVCPMQYLEHIYTKKDEIILNTKKYLGHTKLKHFCCLPDTPI